MSAAVRASVTSPLSETPEALAHQLYQEPYERSRAAYRAARPAEPAATPALV